VLTLTLGALFVEVRSGARANRYQAYQDLTREYADFLWQASFRPELGLDDIWDAENAPEAVTSARRDPGRPHDITLWNSIDGLDRVRYRYTRQALELFERAWQLRTAGIIGHDTWGKWQNWIALWAEANWLFWPVYEETGPRMVRGFCVYLERSRRHGFHDPREPLHKRLVTNLTG
jgi:hypothetical protein